MTKLDSTTHVGHTRHMKHTNRPNQEWGSKARKEEDRLRGLNNADRTEAIAEQVADLEGDES